MNTTTQPAVIITRSGISAIINGTSYVVETDHPKYDQALDAIRNKNWNQFVDLVNISKQVKSYFDGTDVEIYDGTINYHGQVIHNTLTKRILNFMRDGLPHEPLLNFFKNLMQNPSKRAVDELYDFLEAGELPITEDGHFLAFKNVRSNYLDIHSGKFDNSVGKVCEMPRNGVDEDKERTCSYGLHFCSIKYLPHFTDTDGGKTMIVKINPKDVVAIPADYNNTKGRTCRYEVVAEYKDDWRSKLNREESGWDSNLYSSDGGEYEGMRGFDYDDSDDEECTYSNGCDENHCFCDDVGYGYKPNGHKFHNVRGKDGKFVKKN
jgi:predicted nucleic acid binding AN1-type Zn finger protein